MEAVYIDVIVYMFGMSIRLCRFMCVCVTVMNCFSKIRCCHTHTYIGDKCVKKCNEWMNKKKREWNETNQKKNELNLKQLNSFLMCVWYAKNNVTPIFAFKSRLFFLNEIFFFSALASFHSYFYFLFCFRLHSEYWNFFCFVLFSVLPLL